VNRAGEVLQARRDLSGSAWFWLVELVPVVAFAGLIVLNHFATTRWPDAFLYNADSLVLPLIKQSISDGERFRWVFSSQLFIFPEAPLYWLSSLPTDSARVALATNAIVNLTALYALLRVNARLVAHHPHHPTS